MSTIVGVFAHPDDEAFGPGGTLAKMAKDNDVYIVCCTDGNHQEKGLKDIRDKELLASAQVLGIKQVIFLNFEDGKLCNANYHQLADEIKKVLDKLKPETIITFHANGVSGHIDHIVVTSVVNFLFPKLKYIKKIMYFCMRDVERKIIPNYFVYMPDGIPRQQTDEIVDVSDVWKIKNAAMQKHRSQIKDLVMVTAMQALLPKEEYFIIKSK